MSILKKNQVGGLRADISTHIWMRLFFFKWKWRCTSLHNCWIPEAARSWQPCLCTVWWSRLRGPGVLPALPDNELLLNDALFLKEQRDKDHMWDRYHLLKRPGCCNPTPFGECTQSHLLFLLAYSSFWVISGAAVAAQITTMPLKSRDETFAVDTSVWNRRALFPRGGEKKRGR